MASDCDYGSVKAPLTSKSSVTITVGQKQCDNIKSNIPLTKVYTRRWLILACFVLFAASNTCHCVQYSIINNIITRYYGVSSLAVDWTSLIFMVTYIPLIFPASYMLDKIGLRWTCIVGCLLNTTGSWIKVFSVSPDRFYVGFIGQTLISCTQMILFTVPSRLTANWFGAQQVSTATAIGVFGLMLGVSVSFLFTPMVVKNHENLDDIGNELSKLFWFHGIFSTVTLVVVFMFFRDDPPMPPSETRRLQKLVRSENTGEFWPVIKRLFSNRSYLALCHSFGIAVGFMNALATLLNQMYLEHFEGGEEEAGQIGLLIFVMGMLGSLVLGFILDKTGKFKLTICTVYAMLLVGQILFGVSLMLEIKWMVYVSAVFLGFFLTSYFSASYEVCAEYTYPEPEGVSAALLNISNQIYGIAIILVFGKVIEIYGDLWAHLGIGLILLNGLITTVCTKDLQKRQHARRNAAPARVILRSTMP